MKTWRIDSVIQTLVLASDGGVPWSVYWGAPLPRNEDLGALLSATARDLTGGMLDRLEPLRLCPMPGSAHSGQPGIVVAETDGAPILPRMAFAGADLRQDGIDLQSREAGLVLTHEIRTHPTGVITIAARLSADRDLRLGFLAAAVLPIPDHGAEIWDIAGKWTREFQIERTPWSAGIRLREARTGRSGHEHPPYALFPEPGCTNAAGSARALHYAWSGGHRMVAEELPDGRRLAMFGHATGAWTRPARTFETAPLALVYSADGLNGIARTFQSDIRDRVVPWPDRARSRPVHYNCWEAVYFNHGLEVLAEIATRAAALGVERFVLDDGWFGRRDDDTSSLGDWQIDRRKWPDGLVPLIRHVESLGMRFGLWVEPEMVNPDSDLFRAHPDWALGRTDQTLGRNQMVLDLSNPKVRDHLFDVFDRLLADHAIDYLKWDHNRLLPVVDAAQTEGIYDLIDRLRAAHPTVEIESCASGGGRIDAGILSRTHRVWLSDCIDAIERVRMQHEAALFLPASVTGSHVGADESHTTGRHLPLAFRAWVAATRHFGFEMDLRTLSEADALTLARITAWWKANRGWMLAGTILRLDASDPAIVAELQMAADESRFVVFAAILDTSRQILPRPLRLTGLVPSARYRLTLVNPEDRAKLSRGPLAFKDGAVILTGQALMTQGIQLPVGWPATMWVVSGERLDGEGGKA